ncbi:class V aminotransferase [Terricaulis sp.]|uniref:kynureninase/PvdN C-terminal domain-containing protein n=1 Tax=Terricaulis sp. TaxID=2768686 RepID=UPI002AC65B62|nr:class V aminotransferase [Terricaulis sp.]MDZ4691957.1 class V aminotransferase [Terricaulis sp.]
MKSYKHLFSRALAASPGRIHFAAHSHHLWPDASYEGHMQAWEDAATLADRKWDKIFGEVIPRAQANVAAELRLPDPRTIGFAPNTHELLMRIFSARKPGKLDVLTTDGEFHSFRRQAQRWEEQGWISRRVVPCEPFETFGERFLAAMREKQPDIAFLSHVMFRSGLRFDGVEELASYASPDGTWIALDLYHSFMAMPCDFSAVADRVFLLGGGYKYAMAGEGAGFIHAPPGYAERPSFTGWFADFGAMEKKQGEVAYSEDGGRFLGATYDSTGLYRFNAVQAMLMEQALDTAAISARAATLRAMMDDAIASGEAGATLRKAEVLHPNATEHQPRFLSLRHPNATAWKSSLMSANVITDARDDILRIGFGLYQDQADVPLFCDAAKKALG